VKRAFVLLAAIGCGGPSASHAASTASPAPAHSADKPEPFIAKAGPGDVVTRCVRTERSSRLGLPLPGGKARPAFSAPLGATRPRYLLSASNRVVVVGEKDFVLFDARGRRIGGAEVGDASFHLDVTAGRLGTIDPRTMHRKYSLEDAALIEEVETGDYVEADVHVGDTRVGLVRGAEGKVHVWNRGDAAARAIAEGKFEPIEAAIDDDRVVHLIVRQGAELSLWSTPLVGGSIGRIKISSRPGDRPRGPPILGAAIRAVVLDDRIVAFARDGKVAYTLRGAVGGAAITADDKLLVANGPRVSATDAQGRTSDLVVETGSTFVTPPILAGPARLYVASTTALHAYDF
jgi:hypothetical protein